MDINFEISEIWLIWGSLELLSHFRETKSHFKFFLNNEKFLKSTAVLVKVKSLFLYPSWWTIPLKWIFLGVQKDYLRFLWGPSYPDRLLDAWEATYGASVQSRYHTVILLAFSILHWPELGLAKVLILEFLQIKQVTSQIVNIVAAVVDSSLQLSIFAQTLSITLQNMLTHILFSTNLGKMAIRAVF